MTTLEYICIPNLEGTFDSQSKCNSEKDALVLPYQPVELNKELVLPLKIPLVAPPLVESSDIGDIANYAYIWFNNSDPYETITEKEEDFIHETITKGTFPTYFKTYSDKDKKELLANEITFVRKQFIKAGLSNITILQIPRILYDLFNLLYFYHTHAGIYAKSNETIRYECDSRTISKKEYDKYTRENIDKFKDNIFELNNRIIDFLNKNSFLDKIDIIDNYKDILDLIMKNIKNISLALRIHSSNPIDDSLKKINILYEILNFEKQPSRANGATGNSILLYRGADFNRDSTIEIKKDGKQYSCSLSQNLSILSGFITDAGACTINFMADLTHPINYTPPIDYWDPKLQTNNDKIKYTINKFMFGDKSPEDSLFFIPPIPPYLQLYCTDELWHPRTKIGSDSPIITGYVHIKGLLCTNIDFTKEYTYLQSNKTMDKLEEMYQSYKTARYIATWLKKYIKYKTKYLELKNQLGK